MNVRAVALAVAVVAGLAAAALVIQAIGDDAIAVGEARLSVDGSALVARADGSSEEVDDTADLRSGDEVTITDGVGRLDLAEGVRYEARAASRERDADDTSLRMARRPELLAGELLVIAPEAASLVAGGTDVEVVRGDAPTAAARLSRSFAVSAATYEGRVDLDSAGATAAVPALRQIEVPSPGRVPRTPRPLVHDGADPWDRRFLGETIDLAESLRAISRGYTASLGPGAGGLGAAFFRSVLPSLAAEPGFTGTGPTEPVSADRDPGETLVGAAITLLAEDGSFGARWDDVFTFRDAGASWGLVALDQGVAPEPLLDLVRRATGGTPFEFVLAPGGDTAAGSTVLPGSPPGGASPEVAGAPGGVDGGPIPDGSAPAPGGSGGPGEGGSGGATPPPTPAVPSAPALPAPTLPPVPSPPPTPLDPVVDPIVGPAVEDVEDVLGGLVDPVAGPGGRVPLG